MGRRRGRGEGTIVRRRDGRWAAAISLGPGRGRRWFYGHSRQEVAAQLAAAIRDRQLGRVLGSSITLGAYLTAWLDALEAGERRSPQTLRDYRSLAKLHVLPALGRIRLTALGVNDVQRLIDRTHARAGARTAAKARALLRVLLNHALREELIGRNVAALTEAPRVTSPEAGFWRAEEARRFLAVVRGHPWEALFIVALALGLRPAEALGLRWPDIDLEGRVLTVRQQLLHLPGRPISLAPTKTGRSRAALPLPELVVEALREHRIRQIGTQLGAGVRSRWDLVFTDAQGRPLQPQRIRRTFHRILKAEGLPPIKLYDATRHTAASLLAAAGVHPSVAQRILRHANVQTTLQIYTHVAPDLSIAAATAIDRALTGPDPA